MLRKKLSTLFDEDASPHLVIRIFNACLALLIIVNVAAVILDSVEPLHQRFQRYFWWIDEVATSVFTVEYGLRVWTSVDFQRGQYKAPVLGRLRYMRSFFALVDLVAVLPAVLGILGAGDLRVLRLLRLVRLLKLTRHSTVFSLLWAVFQEEARSIGAVLFILALTLTMSGALMYMFEGDVQPTVFTSIPAAMWWAIETLTTVGYGDMVPLTIVGKVLGGIVSIVGVGTLALFSGIITYPKGLDGRMRDSNGEARHKRRDTLVGTLRETYGENFAEGYRSDTQLGKVLKREGVDTLDQLLKK